ncbi:hypothetical protein [Parasitella parasitica]|uniref:Uncharacterized protein n=1 Tax=Parasitella parasitica TaxID=35722 RepID=A0A0B7NMC4_9FUNG|nr:hypothetical protein [Parasitella parasitica]
MIEIESSDDEVVEFPATLTINTLPGRCLCDGNAAARVESYFRANSASRVAVLPPAEMLHLFMAPDVDDSNHHLRSNIDCDDFDSNSDYVHVPDANSEAISDADSEMISDSSSIEPTENDGTLLKANHIFKICKNVCPGKYATKKLDLHFNRLLVREDGSKIPFTVKFDDGECDQNGNLYPCFGKNRLSLFFAPDFPYKMTKLDFGTYNDRGHRLKIKDIAHTLFATSEGPAHVLVHILFPNIETEKNNTFLATADQKLFVDHILVPGLKGKFGGFMFKTASFGFKDLRLSSIFDTIIDGSLLDLKESMVDIAGNASVRSADAYSDIKYGFVDNAQNKMLANILLNKKHEPLQKIASKYKAKIQERLGDQFTLRIEGRYTLHTINQTGFYTHFENMIRNIMKHERILIIMKSAEYLTYVESCIDFFSEIIESLNTRMDAASLSGLSVISYLLSGLFSPPDESF